MTRPLPATLRKLAAANPDKIDEGWTEQDDFAGPEKWCHWVFLKPGWRNAWLDPLCPVHIIHEYTVRDVMQQFRGIKPCDCEECARP